VLLSVVFYIAAALAGSGCGGSSPPSRRLPDFALTAVTADGASPFDRRALQGRVWIADFVYTTCRGPCPLLSADMASLQRRLPPSVGLLSFTVDPDHDSPEVLAVYARRFGADPQRWFFLTGDRPELARLLRDGFQVASAEDAAAGPGRNITHTTRFVLIDARGRLRGYFDGSDPAALDALVIAAKRL